MDAGRRVELAGWLRMEEEKSARAMGASTCAKKTNRKGASQEDPVGHGAGERARRRGQGRAEHGASQQRRWSRSQKRSVRERECRENYAVERSRSAVIFVGVQRRPEKIFPPPRADRNKG
jgi:hypothetical protein